jgi:5-methylcytosine-specific restriction endonuclease McrA
LYREVPLFTQDAIDRTDVPRRSDLVDEIREYQNDKHVLYGQQEGHCNGCGGMFEFRNLEVDHVVPRAKGGSDHISNYQLLCGFCNRSKGKGSHAELLAKLRRDGIIAA